MALFPLPLPLPSSSTDVRQGADASERMDPLAMLSALGDEVRAHRFMADEKLAPELEDKEQRVAELEVCGCGCGRWV